MIEVLTARVALVGSSRYQLEAGDGRIFAWPHGLGEALGRAKIGALRVIHVVPSGVVVGIGDYRYRKIQHRQPEEES